MNMRTKPLLIGAAVAVAVVIGYHYFWHKKAA